MNTTSTAPLVTDWRTGPGFHTAPGADPRSTVLVLRTTVNTPGQVKLLAPALAKLLGNVRWTFDLEDRDRVLRIEQGVGMHEEVVALLTRTGFMCAELD